MRALLNRPSQRLAQPQTDSSQENIAIYARSMTNRHTCPCCSYVLLRHLSSKILYWRCSHCYQAMPIL